MKPILAAFALAVALPVAAQAATLTYAETEFAAADTTVVTLIGSTGWQSIVQTTGGNPGNAALVTTSTNAVTQTGFLFADMTLALASRSLDSLSWSIAFSPVNTYGQGHAYGFLLEQDGSYFTTGGFITGSPSAGWYLRTETDRLEGDFSQLGGTGASISFAQGAAPITMGFYTANDRGNGIGYKYDNLQVTAQVSAVPLPAGLPLALAGIGAFGVLRRYRSRR